MVKWIITALVYLGLGIVTYTMFDTAYDALHSYILGQWSALPADVFQILSLLGFNEGIGLLFSALSIRLAILTRSQFGKLSA